MSDDAGHDVFHVFQKGCLLQLSISVWGASKKLPKGAVTTESDSDYIRASKLLVDPANLDSIKKVSGAVRNGVRDLCLPFPIDGFLFVSKDSVNQVDGWLDSQKGRFDAAVSEFVSRYSWARDVARSHLGANFSETDYPADIRSKFNFSWRFVLLAPPAGKGASILSPELVARERASFLSLMEQARIECVQALREEFAGLVDHMASKLAPGPDGKLRVFRDSLVGNFADFFANFKSRNCFDDSELSALVTRAQAVLSGVGPDDLRGSAGIRSRVAGDVAEIKRVVDNSIITVGRKLRLSGGPDAAA